MKLVNKIIKLIGSQRARILRITSMFLFLAAIILTTTISYAYFTDMKYGTFTAGTGFYNLEILSSDLLDDPVVPGYSKTIKVSYANTGNLGGSLHVETDFNIDNYAGLLQYTTIKYNGNPIAPNTNIIVPNFNPGNVVSFNLDVSMAPKNTANFSEATKMASMDTLYIKQNAIIKSTNSIWTSRGVEIEDSSSITGYEDSSLMYACATVGGKTTITGFNQEYIDSKFGGVQPTQIILPTQCLGGGTVEAIGDGAFMGKGLTSIVIPPTVKTIGNNAFKDNNIGTVRIPVGVTSIGASAFNGSGIDSVYIPDTVTSIGSSAFGANGSGNKVYANLLGSDSDWFLVLRLRGYRFERFSWNREPLPAGYTGNP